MLCSHKGHIVTIRCDGIQNYMKLLGVLNACYEYQVTVYKEYYTFVIDIKTKKYTEFMEWLVYQLFKPLY